MDNKILIVLGMHRSGTSLLAQWLYKCGLNIGNELNGPGRGNMDGHFEDIDFVLLHERILTANGIRSTGLEDTPVTMISSYYEKLLTSIIEMKNQLSGQWGWKDPRTCLFLPVYKQMIPHAKYIIIVRDYNSVLNSLINRDFLNAEHRILKNRTELGKLGWTLNKGKRKINFYEQLTDRYLRVWIKYNDEILTHVRKCTEDNFMLFGYNLFINHSRDIFEYLKERWKLDFEYSDLSNIYKESLISSKIDLSNFVRDKSLINKATELEAALLQYEFKLS